MALPLRSRALLALTPLLMIATMAYGEQFPSRYVKLIVPFPPGGSVDIVARIIAPAWGKALGQSVVIENRPGAGGNIGADAVAKSSPDGYTLLLCQSGSHALSPALYKSLSYNATRDLVPVYLIGTTPGVLVVGLSVQTRTVQEYLAYAKANPGKVTYGSSGIGASGHLSGEWFQSITGVELQHVPYKGGAPAQADLIGGHVMSMFGSLAEQVQVVKSGKIRALAVTSSRRSAQLPNVPTMSEAGVSGFDVSFFYGVCAPTKVPSDIRGKISAALAKAMTSIDVKEQLVQSGYDPVAGGSEDFAKID